MGCGTLAPVRAVIVHRNLALIAADYGVLFGAGADDRALFQRRERRGGTAEIRIIPVREAAA